MSGRASRPEGAGSGPPPALARPGPAWTLQRRVGLLCLLIALFGVVVAGSAALALRNLTTARRSVIDEIDPARVATLEAYAALASQESGVRGFALSGQQSFLEPFDIGQLDANDALRRLEQLVLHRPGLAATVSEVRRRIAAWEQGAAVPAIRAASAGQLSPDPTALAAGKELFDEVRSGFQLLEKELDSAKAAAQGRLDRALHRFVLVLAAGVMAFLVVAAVSFAVLRRWVTDPTARLADDARQVASGDLDHEVVAVGPPELASLGHDIEAMRRRITDELATAEAANRALETQQLELQRSNAELEQFAYVASHDLQEPLRKVASFCQLIEKRYADQLDDRGRQYIDFAVDGAKRMQALINDLLTFSRVGRTTDRFRAVDLNQVAGSAVASLERLVQESGATVVVGPLPTVHGDPALLNLVLLNLIGNAIKFRSEEAPVVELSAARQGDQWLVRITDNGIGIPDQYAERIFVIFQRLHGRDEYEGTGIGLSLCRKIIEFHGGRIAVDLGRPTGTSLTFTLPVVEPAADPATDAPEEAAFP